MDKDDKILRRVKNLLDMAGDSSSPNEAMIAAKRARALMDKHQISKEDLLAVDNSSFGTASGSYKPRNVPTWVRVIHAATAYLNDCQSIIKRGREDVEFEFRGFKSDAIIAKYTHDYLIDTCNRLLERSEAHGKSEKNFYRLGFGDAINQRISIIVSERKIEMKTVTGKELVVKKMELVDAHFPVLKSARDPDTRMPNEREMAAAAKGARDANNVSLDKQVSSDMKPELIT